MLTVSALFHFFNCCENLVTFLPREECLRSYISLRSHVDRNFDSPTSLSGEDVSGTGDTVGAANYRPLLFGLCLWMDSGRD